MLARYSGSIRPFLIAFASLVLTIQALNVTFEPSSDQEGYYSRSWLFVNATCNDSLSVTPYLVFNGSQIEFNSSENGTYFSNLTSLSDGNYTLAVYCDNSLGENTTTEYRSIVLDTIPPAFSYVLPTFSDGSNINIDTSAFIWVNTSCIDEWGLPAIANEVDNPQLYWQYDDYNMTSDVITGTSDYYYWTFSNLIEGNYSYQAFCYDRAGNSALTPWRHLIVDQSAPSNEIITPTPLNGSILASSSFSISFRAIDNPYPVLSNFTLRFYNLSSIYSIYFGNLSGSDDSPLINFTGFQDGNYTFNITVFDKAGNNESSNSRIFSIDTYVAPIILAPSSDSGTVRRSYVTINASCNGSDVQALMFNWKNQSNYTFASNSGGYYWTTMNDLADGTYQYFAFCNDSLGNVNYSEFRTVVLNTQPDPTPQRNLDGGGSSGPASSSAAPTATTAPIVPENPSPTSAIQNEIPIVIEATQTPTPAPSEEALFDVVVEVIKKDLSAGEAATAKISFTKFNTGGSIEVDVLYEIKNSEGKVVAMDRDSQRVEVTQDFLRAIDLPKNLPSGNYEYFAKITYGGGKTAESSDTFAVVGGAEGKTAAYASSLLDYWAYFLGVVLSTSFIFVWQFYPKKRLPDFGKLPEVVAKKADLTQMKVEGKNRLAKLGNSAAENTAPYSPVNSRRSKHNLESRKKIAI